MLAKRVIPCLDVDRGRVVKGTNFLNLRDAGDPVEVAARYEKEGADELVFLDITASHEGRGTHARHRAADGGGRLHAPDGGRRHPHDRGHPRAAERRLRQGVHQLRRLPRSRVCPPGGAAFGSQCIVVNIDPKRVWKDGREVWEVHINGGRLGTGLEAVAWARRVEELGAGEIVLTSMDADGTLTGYDLAITRAVADAVSIPVVASGGAGCPDHLADAILLGGADAALAASIFHYGAVHDPRKRNNYAPAGNPRSAGRVQW